MDKPQMQFKAILVGKDLMITAVCPHAHAWFESMNKRMIKPTELSYVGRMGIEVAMVEGKVFEAQKVLGRDKISDKGVLTGKFDALEQMKKG